MSFYAGTPLLAHALILCANEEKQRYLSLLRQHAKTSQKSSRHVLKRQKFLHSSTKFTGFMTHK